MDEAHINKIRRSGFWRINLQPATLPTTLLTLKESLSVVEKNKISLTGWDYPHVQVNNSSNGATEYLDDCVQSWVDFAEYIEFWRMYRSSQFLHYIAMREDFVDNFSHQVKKPAGLVLGVTRSIFIISQIAEFAFRLHSAGLYHTGLTVKLTLGNTAGRQLWVDSPNRLAFSYPRITNAESLSIHSVLTTPDVVKGPRIFAINLLQDLFDKFGWSPPSSLIESDQERLFSRQLY